METTRSQPELAPGEIDPKVSAWRAFVETSARLQTILDDELRRDAGMSLSDYNLLLLLSEAPHRRLRMRDLSTRMAFSTSRLSYQVDTLVRRGWLCRQPDPDDRRGSFAVLTDDGAAAFTEAAVGHFGCVQRTFLNRIDHDDAADLARIMARLQP